MKLKSIRISNFQSFGKQPTEITFENITHLIGPNGSGKTAVLQTLSRLFAFEHSLRKIQRSDFHVPFDEQEIPDERTLWIEADFIFPELKEDKDNSTVAPYFKHMRLYDANKIPRVRYRLTATLDIDGDIDENFVYVLNTDSNGSPLNTSKVPKSERNNIHIHYLPARRDPASHITYGANALLGRMLRAISWQTEREEIKTLTDKISESLGLNPSVIAFSKSLKTTWGALHKGSFFTAPQITFISSEIENLLRHLSVSFSPGHEEEFVDFSRLSDGQKSMLYLSIVLTSQMIGRAVLSGENDSFDPIKLRPPVFTLVAIEEPENSLSPHYLGRILSALNSMTRNEDAQALIATHAPSMLRRVDPTHIRYLRLNHNRITIITHIQLPNKNNEAYKFVREAVQAFPEIYFSRLVVLGEGDSEEIVLPRILGAKGIPVDECAITIAPLGGRHVNHFWRLLSALDIPFVTLLDLDLARFQGGWGRIKYVNDQLKKFREIDSLANSFPEWNSDSDFIREDESNIIQELEQRAIFFSYPMDLDFSMLMAYPNVYNVEGKTPNKSTITTVLGKKYYNSNQYTQNELKLFNTYRTLFLSRSKPATHIEAFANLSDEKLLSNVPDCLNRLADAVIKKLKDLPE